MSRIHLSLRIVSTALACALLAAACSDDQSDVVVGTSDTTDTTDAQSLDGPMDEIVEDTTALPLDPTTTTTAPTTTTIALETTTTLGPTTTETSKPSGITLADDETIEVLGPAMVGVGDWAVIRGERSEDEECHAGTLAFVIDGEIVHRYDELGHVYGTRLFNGLRGQDAFVINCEESVERILLQGSAVLPEFGWPVLTDIALYGDDAPDVRLFFDADFAWRADVFSGYGTISTPDRGELLVFDPATGEIEPLGDRIGERTDLDSSNGADAVVPFSWMADSEDGLLSVMSNASYSRVQLQRLDNDVEDPPSEGDDFMSSDSVMVWLWSQPTVDGHAEMVELVAATDWTYLSEDGVRVVRRIPVGASTVEVELFADHNDSAIDQYLPWLVLDLIRVFVGPISSS